jgi:hypothetical protein
MLDPSEGGCSRDGAPPDADENGTYAMTLRNKEPYYGSNEY